MRAATGNVADWLLPVCARLAADGRSSNKAADAGLLAICLLVVLIVVDVRNGPRRTQARAGIHLPRVAVDQFNASLPVSDPKPDDLVFIANTYEPGISHVGIYIGNALQMNAPTTEQVVSVAPVFTGYWANHYAGTRRVRVSFDAARALRASCIATRRNRFASACAIVSLCSFSATLTISNLS